MDEYLTLISLKVPGLKLRALRDSFPVYIRCPSWWDWLVRILFLNGLAYKPIAQGWLPSILHCWKFHIFISQIPWISIFTPSNNHATFHVISWKLNQANFKLDNNSLVFLGCDSLEIQTGKILLTAKSIIEIMLMYGRYYVSKWVSLFPGCSIILWTGKTSMYLQLNNKTYISNIYWFISSD